MKELIIIILLIIVGGCAAYKLPEGAPGAELIVEAPNLRQLTAYPDDMAIIQMFDINDNGEESKFGFFRVLAEKNTEKFKIPANKEIKINAIQNISRVGGATSCEVPLKFTPLQNKRYKLLVNYTAENGECSASINKNKNGSSMEIVKNTALDKSVRFDVNVKVK